MLCNILFYNVISLLSYPLFINYVKLDTETTNTLPSTQHITHTKHTHEYIYRYEQCKTNSIKLLINHSINTQGHNFINYNFFKHRIISDTIHHVNEIGSLTTLLLCIKLITTIVTCGIKHPSC